VPYNLLHELVEVCSTSTAIEILNKSQRLAYSDAIGYCVAGTQLFDP
jgi:hypothetical protein